MRIGIKPGQWGWGFGELQASWRAADEEGFEVISCFDHVTSQPAGAVAWDAPASSRPWRASPHGPAWRWMW